MSVELRIPQEELESGEAQLFDVREPFEASIGMLEQVSCCRIRLSHCSAMLCVISLPCERKRCRSPLFTSRPAAYAQAQLVPLSELQSSQAGVPADP